ncbi:MAG: metallophosphoesterase [Bacteroidales bacterium]|nr:metallophosphoesterase [Bacteroidales bacterium]
MRKYIIFIVILILLVPGYFLFEASHPKTAGRFPFMVFLLAVDIYLWVSVRKKIKSWGMIARIVTGFLYWFPLASFVLLTAISAYRNVHLVYPPLVSYVLGIAVVAYFAKLITVAFFLLADIYRIVRFIFRHARAKKTGIPVRQPGQNMSRGKFIRTMGLATGGVLFSGMLIGMVKWAHDIRVRRVNLRLPRLPWAFEGLRIVQISDLHLGSWATTGPIEEAATIINDLDPDIVLFTGDLVNYSTDEAYRFKDILKSIRGRHGVYAVLGNHDYGDYVNWPSNREKDENMLRLIDYYEKIGWKLLRNQNEILESEGERLALIGVENWSSNARFPKLGNISEALQGTGDIPVKILMSHDPSHWEKEISIDYPEIDITLSGHTHGFQFGVELKRIRWSLAQYMYKYWAGLYQNEGAATLQYLYVNRGLGMIGYPGRVGILPEITLITLES